MQTTTSTPRRGANRLILLLAVLLGLAAAVLVVLFLRSLEARRPAPVPMVSVVVAREDIPAGQKITPALVELRQVPENTLVQGAATSIDQVVDQTLRYPVAKGEQISTARLVTTGRVQAISFQIPPGKRAFTIPVNVTESPAALIAPGDFVDVIAVMRFKDLNLQPPQNRPANVSDDELLAAVTVLQNVQVLSVQQAYVENGVPYDPSVRGNPPKNTSVNFITLALTPEQAQALALVRQQAKELTLALRPFGDLEPKPLGPFAWPLRLDDPALASKP